MKQINYIRILSVALKSADANCIIHAHTKKHFAIVLFVVNGLILAVHKRLAQKNVKDSIIIAPVENGTRKIGGLFIENI